MEDENTKRKRYKCFVPLHTITLHNNMNEYLINVLLLCVLFVSVCSLERIVTCYYWGAICRLLFLRWASLCTYMFLFSEGIYTFILDERNIFFFPKHGNTIDYLFTACCVCCLFASQMMRSLASVLAFEIVKMLYRSGIKMRLLLPNQISWGKSMSSSHP